MPNWFVCEFRADGTGMTGRVFTIGADDLAGAVKRTLDACLNHIGGEASYIGPSGKVVYGPDGLAYTVSIALEQDAREQENVEMPWCANCEANPFKVTSTDLWEAGGVIACEYCDALLSPQLGVVIDLIEKKFGRLS